MISTPNEPAIVINACLDASNDSKEALKAILMSSNITDQDNDVDALSEDWAEVSKTNNIIHIDICGYSQPLSDKSYDLSDLERIAPLLQARNTISGSLLQN